MSGAEVKKRGNKIIRFLGLMTLAGVSFTLLESPPSYASPHASDQAFGHSSDLTPTPSSIHQKLARAVKANQLAQVQKLLKLGANANFKNTNPYHYPLLLIAMINGNSQIVSTLLRYGADPNATDGRRTPILVSAASFVVPGQKASSSVLKSISTLLRSQKINVNQKDKAYVGDGRGAIHVAASNGSLDLVQILLKHGAHVNQRNRIGETPLHFAAAKGNNEMVSYLLKNGANPNIQTHHSLKTPLVTAADAGNLSTLRLLIQKNGNPHLKDAFGKNSIEAARSAVEKKREKVSQFMSTMHVQRKLSGES